MSCWPVLWPQQSPYFQLTGVALHVTGRSLANPASQLLEINPTYAPYATAYYNGTLNAFPDPFEAVNGGYHVNVTTTVYGYQRLIADATTLTFQVCLTSSSVTATLCLQ